MQRLGPPGLGASMKILDYPACGKEQGVLFVGPLVGRNVLGRLQDSLALGIIG
jgi:hypothetical protein